MKHYYWLAALLMTVASCRREKAGNVVEGVITGVDYRKCACCGGLMINFEHHRTPYTGTWYLIRKMPAGVAISEKSAFPIDVWAEVQPVADQPCGNSFIDIIKIQKK